MNAPAGRRAVLAAAALSWTARLAAQSALPAPRVAASFAGRIDDRGFDAAGWQGLERARSELGVSTSHVEGVLPIREAMVAALSRLATGGADLVIAHGAQFNESAVEVAARFPRQRFVVTQGSVTGVNLASYEVLQEESAYLAGVLAGGMSVSGQVGHLGGLRTRWALKSRAAFAAGAQVMRPDVKLLTHFVGSADDAQAARRAATAMAEARADVLFAMLEGGRVGVTELCRERGLHLIGAGDDWVAQEPGVYIGSAVADMSLTVFEAVRDLREDRLYPGTLRRLGLAHRQAVRLTMAADLPAQVKDRVHRSADRVRAGHVLLPDGWNGTEFVPGRS